MNRSRRWGTTLWLALRGRIETRVPFWAPQVIRQRQTRQVRQIVAHAFRYVPFYQDIAKTTGLRATDIRSVEDLQKLPLIDGRTLQADPIAFVSTAFPLSSLMKLHSTGTSAYGTKTVYWHPRELLSKVAFGERDRSILRKLLGQTRGLVRLSFFHPDSSTSQVSRFRATHLAIPQAMMTTHWASSASSFDEITQLLDDLQPDVVYSYGSFAEVYLLHILDQGLTPPLPRVWVFGGDGVSSEGRRQIEETLPCVLYSNYQAVEAGRFGFECEKRNGYHINSDFCHVRLVNNRGATVAPGESGEVVISNLSNPGSILLNYKLGDLAVWNPGPCPCGRNLPMLHLTRARTGSYLRLRSGGTLQEHVLMHACKESLGGVLQYQILEKAPESIVWRLLLAQDADLEEISSELVECSRAAIGPEADISVEAVNRILPLDGLKLTRIVRIQSRENGRGSRNDTPR